MFKFNFFSDENGADETVEEVVEDRRSGVKLKLHSLEELLSTLPEAISYSFISLPAFQAKLPRRELFDVKLQLLADDDSQMEESTKYVNSPSDLVRGVYEGGLKTWECSIDLASYLLENCSDTEHKPKRVLELGCGSALPTLALFQKHLSSPTEEVTPIEFQLQDFNHTVLSLVTLPNLLLTWYFSSAATQSRQSQPSDPEEPKGEEDLELTLTPSLLSSFQLSLKEYKIELKFISGPWSSFPSGTSFDLILTSETIYQPESYKDLTGVIKNNLASVASSTPKELQEGIKDLSLSPSSPSHFSMKSRPYALIASKVLYFGVGGGIDDFSSRIRNEGGKVEAVWSNEDGVRRKIVRVDW